MLHVVGWWEGGGWAVGKHFMAKEARKHIKLFSISQAAIEQGREGMLRHDALAGKKPTHRIKHNRINSNCVKPGDGHELLQHCLLQCYTLH